MTESLVTPAEMNALISSTPFLAPYRFVVSACRAGECEMLVPFQPELERLGGIISGMTFMGAADVAMWLAIMTLRGTAETWVTSDMKTAFLNSARQEDVVCRARVLKAGTRTMYGTAECVGNSESGNTNKLFAHHVLTYARVSA